MLRLSIFAVALLPCFAFGEEFHRVYVGTFDDRRSESQETLVSEPAAADTATELNAKTLFQLDEALEQARLSQEKVAELDAKFTAMQEGFQSSSFIDHRGGKDTVAAGISERLNSLESRVAQLEGRVDKVEEQLLAVLTVRKADGSVAREAVTISHVHGYGSFDVPTGGVVTHIDGKPVRGAAVSATTTIRGTATYIAAPAVGSRVDIYPTASQQLRTTTSGRVVNQRGRLFNWPAVRSNNVVCVGPDCR